MYVLPLADQTTFQLPVPVAMEQISPTRATLATRQPPLHMTGVGPKPSILASRSGCRSGLDRELP